jgi:hypothetical protein
MAMTRYHWIIGIALLGATVWFPVTGMAQDDEKLTVRFYPVQDLLIPRQGYRFNGRILPGVDPAAEYQNRVEYPFVGEMGGAVGGGMGGGGGFFAVPDRVAAQIGGGAGKGGFAGPGFGLVPSALPTGSENPHGIEIDDLMSVISRMVEPDQWEEVGGENVLDFLGGQLVVRATNEVHIAVEAFLNQVRLTTKQRVPVHVQAFWVHVDRNNASSFPTKGPELEAILKGPQLAIVGRVTCLNGQSVTISAGTRETVTANVIPVVGGHAMAYSPQNVFPNIGALLEVKPLLFENDQRVMMNVHSTVSRLSGKSTTRKHGDIDLDHPSIDAHQILTTVVAPLDQYFVAGGLTMSAAMPTSAEAIKTIFLVLKVSKQAMGRLVSFAANTLNSTMVTCIFKNTEVCDDSLLAYRPDDFGCGRVDCRTRYRSR